MFLLNNIHDFDYKTRYPTIPHVAFDLGEAQINNAKNRDWKDIVEGSIICVVSSSRKISLFRRVEEKRKTDETDKDDPLWIIIGRVIGRLDPDRDMEILLNKYHVSHPYLPRNLFSIGFNVGNLGDALDALSLKTKNGMKTLGELKRGA